VTRPEVVGSAAPVQLAALKAMPAKQGVAIVLAASAAALALLVYVIYGHGRAEGAPGWVAGLPALNATLNGASAVLLVLAGLAVRRRALVRHARLMIGALACSAAFLVSYVVYHAFHGDSHFAGHGAVRPLYFFVLISHIACSAAVLPLIFSSFFFSLSGRFSQHKKVSRYTFPVWLYVSVTGVMVFLMLRAYA
jgi:putative membrane protein